MAQSGAGENIDDFCNVLSAHDEHDENEPIRVLVQGNHHCQHHGLIWITRS